MAITSVDILNLSHSLKDICEINCNTPECLSQVLKILMQYNLIQANLQFSRQFCQADDVRACLPAPPAVPIPAASGKSGACAHASTASAAPCPRSSVVSDAPGSSAAPKAPIRLDIADPFLADYEK